MEEGSSNPLLRSLTPMWEVEDPSLQRKGGPSLGKIISLLEMLLQGERFSKKEVGAVEKFLDLLKPGPESPMRGHPRPLGRRKVLSCERNPSCFREGPGSFVLFGCSLRCLLQPS